MPENIVSNLLTDHRKKHLSQAPDSRLNFALQANEGQFDVYNISAPFIWDDEIYLLGRVEARDSEHSHIGFFQPAAIELIRSDTISASNSDHTMFRKIADVRSWIQVDGSHLPLQDPFVTIIAGELVIGGVEITEDSSGRLNYRTVFHKGKSVKSLQRIFTGPWGMKDIRLKELADGRILLLTRPQGEIGGRGTIGWTVLPSLSDLSLEKINGARLLSDQFLAEEWGGANEIHQLRDSVVGILSHIARFDEAGDRHYYASVFSLDYGNGTVSPMKIIAERKDFAPGESKRDDLADVIFSGGLIRLENEKAALYCGAGDAEAHVRLIKVFEITG